MINLGNLVLVILQYLSRFKKRGMPISTGSWLYQVSRNIRKALLKSFIFYKRKYVLTVLKKTKKGILKDQE